MASVLDSLTAPLEWIWTIAILCCYANQYRCF